MASIITSTKYRQRKKHCIRMQQIVEKRDKHNHIYVYRPVSLQSDFAITGKVEARGSILEPNKMSGIVCA